MLQLSGRVSSSDPETEPVMRGDPNQARLEAVDLFGSKPVELIQGVGAIGIYV
jgi:hypothetical protein